MQQLQHIIIGDLQSPSFTFEGDDILSTSGDFSVDMIGAELCTDVMEAEVSYDDASGTLRSLSWATPVYFYNGEHLEGKLYSISVTRTGRKAYRIRATSAAGILEYEKFYGGLYNGETFKDVAEGIIGSNGLQPFDGVYRHYVREKDATGSMIGGYGMGLYSDQGKTQTYGNAPFLSTTMSSKLSTKIKILGFSNQSYALYSGSPETTYRSQILGVTANSDASENIKKHRYGLYMQMARASTSDPFPAFGEVFFVYGQTEISLGTPASADDAVYEIEVDPGAGTAVINGVSHSISLDRNVADDACALHVYGGGASLYDDYGRIFASLFSHHCEFETFFYTVRAPGGELQADFTAVRNIYTGKVGAYDYVSHKLQNDLQNSTVWAVDLEPYDVLTYGGSMLFNNRTDFQTDVLASLSYADGIDTIPVYGWLPICTKREALHQLLFATGVILTKDEGGAILFTAPSTQPVGAINSDDVYDEGSEDKPERTNAVELTEHSFSLNTISEAETIYEDNTGSSSEYYIAPFSVVPAKHQGGIWLDGVMTCIYANCNAALVTGSGKLMGRPYSHTEKVLRREIANFPDGHAVSVLDATLVTPLNSENVMDRLAAYYSAAHKTQVDIVQNGERCGLLYTLTSAFGEAFSGFLVRASKVVTSIVRSTCEFIRGYTPPKIGDVYTNYVILTGSGTWTVPELVFEKETPRIRVVLIGGGNGGDGGFAGADGVQPVRGSGVLPAEGGAPGDSGSGGKILEFTITNPAASYTYSCGQGGAGGRTSDSHTSNNPGSDGGDTIFSGGGRSYSSENGAASENGIVNSITGERYAGRLISSPYAFVAARSGGGNGGSWSDETSGLEYRHAGNCQQTIMNTAYKGWIGGYVGDSHVGAFGGGGGGAGYGQDGADGSAGSYLGDTFRSGDGGKGGDATEVPPKATDYNPAYYGYGGLGGGGGGGGGAGGWVTEDSPSIAGTGGAGGYGGRGGDGGDGCVLIYY